MARNSGGGFGTWFYGFLVGGVIGVGCCAAAALYITKAPIPFVNKVNQASEKINPIAGGTIPDPNKPLSASGGAPVNAPKSRVVTVEPPTSEQAAEETKLQIEQGSRFVVQAGAFSTQVDAEARRASDSQNRRGKNPLSRSSRTVRNRPGSQRRQVQASGQLHYGDCRAR